MTVAPGLAHYQVHGYDTPIKNRFYFQGYTYTKEDGAYKRSDPLNLTFLSTPSSSIDADQASVKNAFYEFWTPGRSGNRMADSSNCLHLATTEYLRFRGFRSYNGAEGDERPAASYQMANGSAATINACKNEFHIRWWSDATHLSLSSRSGADDPHKQADEWAIGAGHHEDRSRIGKHYIDRDWYLVTNQIARRMVHYCRFRRYLYDPRAEGPFGPKDSDGYIMAITFQSQRPCTTPKIK